MKQHVLSRSLVSVLAGGCLIWAVSGPTSALPDGGHGNGQSFVLKPTKKVEGLSQKQWSAKWWQWFCQLPAANHPGGDVGTFDVTAGQTGDVWFLAAPVVYDAASSVTRSFTLPADKSLFVMLIGSEWSSLEGYPTEQEQRDFAVWFGDHTIPASLSCTLDGVSLSTPTAYRQESAQFDFNAPTPWIFGATGGASTAVADGYYVFLKELDPGQHTLHYTGLSHFTLEDDGFDYDGYINMTYNITQEDEGCGGRGH